MPFKKKVKSKAVKPEKTKSGKVQRWVSIANKSKRLAEGWREIKTSSLGDLVLMEK